MCACSTVRTGRSSIIKKASKKILAGHCGNTVQLRLLHCSEDCIQLSLSIRNLASSATEGSAHVPMSQMVFGWQESTGMSGRNSVWRRRCATRKPSRAAVLLSGSARGVGLNVFLFCESCTVFPQCPASIFLLAFFY